MADPVKPTDEKREYTPTPAQSVPLDPDNAKIERIDQLPPEPEPRIKDPASTISPNTATSFGGTTPLGPGQQRTMKQAIDLARKTEKDRKRMKKESEVFINLGTPLIVKTKHGELQAGPGDVVMRLGPKEGHSIVVSQDAYTDLGKFKFDEFSYEDLLRKSLKRGVIARRLDDGNRIPMTPEQEAEADKNIEEEVKNHREAREVEAARRQKLVNAFSGKEGESATVADVWNAVDSGEGPPTATPADSATLVPQYIPIEVLDEAGEGEGEVGTPATGATAGSPGSFTPSGSDVPADFAALSSCTASPSTAWLPGEHVVLGDASQAYWNGTSWVVGSAPAARGVVPQAAPRR